MEADKTQKTGQINVEVLKLQLLRQKITRARFKFPFEEADAYKIIMAAYETEVRYRCRQFVNDDKTRASVASFVRALTSKHPRFGILLCGTCGNGKTTMVYAFQNALNLLVRTGRLEREWGLQIVDAKEIVRKTIEDYKFYTNLRSKEMLAIEDIGREPAETLDYGNILSPIVDLLEYRYDQQLYTIVTTNLKPQELRSHYGDRIADRLNEMFDKVIIQDGSYRLTSKPNE